MVGASGGVVLTYDPLGRLYQVTGSSSTTTFLYDGDALVAEYNGSTLLRRHIHNVGADVPVVTFVGADLSTPRYLFADHQGSIVALSDAGGSAVAINSYDEYGIPGSGNTGRFQYTGQIWLSELGMYHYKARVYSPTLGRFMQTDPIGYEDQFNLYAYVGNDPGNATDPSGTEVRVTIAGYPLANAGGYGHSYVAYRDMTTGEMRITRAYSEPYYAGGSAGAVLNIRDRDSQLVAIDTPFAESVDRPSENPNSIVLDTRIIPDSMESVRSRIDAFNERVNDEDVAYGPQSPNSNTYAGDTYEMLTGEEPQENSNLDFPGLRGDVFPRPSCLPLKDTTSCPSPR